MEVEAGFFPLHKDTDSQNMGSTQYASPYPHKIQRGAKGWVPNQRTELRVIIPRHFWKGVVHAERFNLIFCGFSETSDFSSPPGRRNGMFCQESQQGQQWLHGVLLFENSHSVIQRTCSWSLCTWHHARCREHRDSSYRHNKWLFPWWRRTLLKREYRERTPLGVPAMDSHIARHVICLVTFNILESKEKTQ